MASMDLLVASFLHDLFLNPENGGNIYVSPKCLWTSPKLHGVTKQSIIIFVATMVKTS
jgi:hypothetical protein